MHGSGRVHVYFYCIDFSHSLPNLLIISRAPMREVLLPQSVMAGLTHSRFFIIAGIITHPRSDIYILFSNNGYKNPQHRCYKPKCPRITRRFVAGYKNDLPPWRRRARVGFASPLHPPFALGTLVILLDLIIELGNKNGPAI